MFERLFWIIVALFALVFVFTTREFSRGLFVSDARSQGVSANALEGQVVTSSGLPIPGATVHLVPTTAIDMTPITASSIYYPPFPAEAYDEPLEDAIRANGSTFPQATTGDKGEFTIIRVPNGKFFIHVTPAEGDLAHLPGGDYSRESATEEQLRGQSITITLSGRPPSNAEYVGSTSCLECHGEHSSWKKTGHKLAWVVPNKPSPSQDFSRFPNYFDSLDVFTVADTYTEGTRLELGDRDSKRRNDKFKLRVAEDERLPIDLVYADIYLWQNAQDNRYYITLENKLNLDDPNSPVDLPIDMLYGGAVHRQRFIVSVPEQLGIRKAHYTVLQFHPDGQEHRLNRTRRLWRDYKWHYWWGAGLDEEYGTSDDLIQAPPINQNTIEIMCAGCHVTGLERYTDEETGELLIRGVDDPNGSFNIDTDPSPDEVNIGCETCHGPGSEHVNTAQDGMAQIEPAIVQPAFLSSERSNVLCGRCHDRRQGVGGPTVGYSQPINEQGEIMMPGESRKTLIDVFTDAAKKGPIPNREIWPDDIHSKSPHQQYADFLKSGMYRNDRILVTCHDCHNIHGDSPFDRWLVSDPYDATSAMCQDCHPVDINEHMDDKLNSRMKGSAGTTCLDCHMPATSVAGGDAGAYGRMIDTPIYDSAAHEKLNAYWQGHIGSHVFDVPMKTNIGVDGVPPGDAMPIPYTNSCGTCHIVDELPYK
ncbi:cytochrome c family protein [Chloroflexi bacterium TSY]|nr:cytochrome c family protein [Chloroflexi bacterium TSY]